MSAFDFGTEAELFTAKSPTRFRQKALGYRRFASAAEAIRFAVEELPPELLRGSSIEVDEQTYDGAEIRRLYESVDFPLPRRCGKGSE